LVEQSEEVPQVHLGLDGWNLLLCPDKNL
jgi:hypothetical protein